MASGDIDELTDDVAQKYLAVRSPFVARVSMDFEYIKHGVSETAMLRVFEF